MKTRTQLIILGIAAMGLTVFLEPLDVLAPLQTRLRGQSVEPLAQSRSLSTLIQCINTVDGPWRRNFEAYQTRETTSTATLLELQNRYPELFNPRYGNQIRDTDGHKLRMAPCLPQLRARLALHNDLPEQERAALYYANALDAMNRQTFRLDFESNLFITLNMKSANVQEAFLPAAERLTDASDKLRPVIEQKDRELRTTQLAQLRERFGEDAHWHVLNAMLAVRDTFGLISEQAQRQTLNPAALETAQEQLKTQLHKAHEYMNITPSNRSTLKAFKVWRSVDPSIKTWLDSLQILNDNWKRHAPPSQLSEDFASMTRAYDRLMDQYNRWANTGF